MQEIGLEHWFSMSLFLQYLEVFKATAIQIDNSNDSELLHAFAWGIKERVTSKVRLRNPKTPDEAAHLALDFAELLHP